MEINFAKFADNLVPAIIQDAVSSKVLMLGYMNKEALEQTRKTGLVTFFSRSRKRLWVKGESSRNFLHVAEVRLDCDQDTLLIKANPAGPVCHTGTDTCFGEKNLPDHFLSALEKIICGRKDKPSETSYTSSLFKKGINKIAQKVGEEAVELIIEAKDENAVRFKNEAADLLFHYLVLLQAKGYTLTDVLEILNQRHLSPSK